ncbi:tripartite motif-containing protein 5-like [Procambarus clarkii]|uniref:tripartite motif-containing protein 5-like n=1 Tax=Procambarus clarkii TaxID=6728 RepID=UPI003743B235
MMDNNPEECSVCFNNYDDNQLRPRTLLCGHTFCSQCIDNAIKNGQLTCPSCRAEHAATAATQFPINYGMEALIRKLKGIEVVPEKTLPAKPIKAPARGISKKLHSMVEEQKSSISSLITSCEEVLSQLGEYRGQLGDWKTHHLQLQDRLYSLVEQNKSAMKLLELEDTSVVDMTTQGEEGKTQLQAMLGSLDTVNTAQEVFMTINEVDQCNMAVENWLKKCQELFPDVKTVHTSVKVQETIREALEMTTTETGATADPVHLGDSASSIMNKVQEITGEIPQKQLTVEDLRRMREPVKRLVEAGRVLAVQEDQDGRRSARITLQDGQLYLHPLLRQPTPAHAHTLQESQRGHTYRNTKLLRVGNKGKPDEWVGGGDYESNDGKGGTPLLPDLQGQYLESGRAGTVLSLWGLGGPRCAQFVITTRDRQDGRQWLNVFGDVVSGLDVGVITLTTYVFGSPMHTPQTIRPQHGKELQTGVLLNTRECPEASTEA